MDFLRPQSPFWYLLILYWCPFLGWVDLLGSVRNALKRCFNVASLRLWGVGEFVGEELFQEVGGEEFWGDDGWLAGNEQHIYGDG